MVRSGEIGRDERVVVYNTGAAQKYIEALEPALPEWDNTMSWETLASS